MDSAASIVIVSPVRAHDERCFKRIRAIRDIMKESV